MVPMAEIVVPTTCDDCQKKFDVHVTAEVGYFAGMAHAPCPSCGHPLGPFPGKVLGVTERLES
jgi:hypothetical protein